MNEPKFFLEPIGGYLLDLASKLRNRPFVPHSLTKLHNLKLCRDLTKATTAVEIGSYKGVTAKRLSYLFENVVTVEIVPELHEIAKKRCRKRFNIDLLLGDGSELLPKIAANVSDAVLFLDGHFSGGDTGQGDEAEPVLQELDLIAESLGNFKAIIIDDFRQFGIQEGWPKKSEVMEKIERILPNPIWSMHILNDQFVMVRTQTTSTSQVKMDILNE